MKKSDVLIELMAYEKKYCDLVWLARKRPDDPPRTLKQCRVIRKKHPQEVARLSGEHSDWEHGFNSGCLAAFRYAIGLLGTKVETEMAIRDFPFLDT
jgi:hypothetical protein